MNIDDSIVTQYLAGEPSERYREAWVIRAFGSESIFAEPDPQHKEWVAALHQKLKRQLLDFVPRNREMVTALFPEFDALTRDYTAILAVGFPDPYDAMFLSHEGRDAVVFDLIQFSETALAQDYSCHRVLTHELLHLCIQREYPPDAAITYAEALDYTAFNEGFAHALSYPENLSAFSFDAQLLEKYRAAKETLAAACRESDPEKQRAFLRAADTGDYWEKFAAISGKLYLLAHKNALQGIYRAGWRGFCEKILQDEP